jgi:sugar/nucleoside kinase (ribokinase family)
VTREQIGKSAAEKLIKAASSLSAMPAVVGFDAFVDEICDVVDKRHSAESYDPIKTIEQFGQKIVAAGGQSSNYELVVKQMKLGGNGPIMANALACAGMAVTYVGNLGYPNLHPVFEEFSSRAKVISIGNPGHTDAVEFTDGKLMVGKITPMNDVNWRSIETHIGAEGLRELYGAAKLIGMVNWTMIPYMGQIWDNMIANVLPGIGRRLLFVDLADPEKRTRADIATATKQLSAFQKHVDVILGLNLKEAGQIAEVIGKPVAGEPELAIEQTAREIRAALGLSSVVIHPRRGAAAATEKECASFAGPFVKEPKISTGAGDHFNAGFCLGRVLGLSLEESLCTGVGTSGYYVRTAISPTAAQLAEFIANLPAPE